MGHTAAAQLLLDRGTDMKATTQSGWTALTVACDNGRIASAQLLERRAADIR